MTKFFTAICFVALLIFQNSANGQILIRNSETGKAKEIYFGTTIHYTLFSDSVLGVYLQPDYGVVTTTADSMIVFQDGSEISTTDIKYLEIESKSLKRWRGIMSPFFIAGLGILSKGTIMAVAEGTESNNEELVPLYTGIGVGVTLLSCYPFLKKNKSYDLSSGKYEIITP